MAREEDKYLPRWAVRERDGYEHHTVVPIHIVRKLEKALSQAMKTIAVVNLHLQTGGNQTDAENFLTKTTLQIEAIK